MRKLLVLAMALILVVSLCAVFASAEAKNAAVGKSYTTTGIYKEGETVLYPDTNSKELTDNVLPAKGDIGYGSAMWVGFNIGGENFGKEVKDHSTITVDLGSAVSGIKAFKLFSQDCGSGISAPAEVEVYVSSDNKTFTSVGKVKGTKTIDGENAAEPTFGIYEYTVAPSAEKTAQYVRFAIKHNTNWAFVSEVQVLTGDVTVTPTSEPTTESTVSESSVADESSAVESTTSKVESTATSTVNSTVSATSGEESKGGESGLGTWGIVGIIAGAAVVVGGGVFLVTRKK